MADELSTSTWLVEPTPLGDQQSAFGLSPANSIQLQEEIALIYCSIIWNRLMCSKIGMGIPNVLCAVQPPDEAVAIHFFPYLLHSLISRLRGMFSHLLEVQLC